MKDGFLTIENSISENCFRNTVVICDKAGRIHHNPGSGMPKKSTECRYIMLTRNLNKNCEKLIPSSIVKNILSTKDKSSK